VIGSSDCTRLLSECADADDVDVVAAVDAGSSTFSVVAVDELLLDWDKLAQENLGVGATTACAGSGAGA